MKQNPFKFLDSYTKADKNIFFGRERETEELYQKVFESKILLVYGITGTGKTSLINCGLANKFNESDWLPIYVRRNQNIMESVTNELSKFSYDEKKRANNKKSILKLLQSVYLDNFKPIYLLFDQFEELFIFSNEEERKEFVELVDAINQSDIQCKMLFILREEFLANITEFERTIPEFFQNRIRIEKMSPAKALGTITGPCKAVGIEIEEQAAENILHKVSKDKSNVELTYLQVLLDKVYQLASERKEEEIKISQEVVDKVGDVEDILGDFLEQQIKTFDNSDDVLNILKSFVSVHGTKKQVSPEEINEHLKMLGQGVEAEKMPGILQQLVSKRILNEKNEQGHYELIHDAIALKIYEKISLVEKEILEVRQFIENAYVNYEKREILLNAEDLSYLDKYSSNLYLPEHLQEFLNKSIRYQQSRSRVVKNITTITIVVFVISLVLSFVFMIRMSLKNEANENANWSLYSIDDPFKRLEGAYDAYNNTKTGLTTRAIFQAFYSVVDLYEDSADYKLIDRFDPCESAIKECRFSSDGNLIWSYLANGKIIAWELDGNIINEFLTGQDEIISFEFSDDNNYIATISKDSTAKIWNQKGQEVFSVKVAYNKRNTRDILRFLNHKNQIVCLSPENDFVIYDLDGNQVQKIKEHKKGVNSLSVSIDERFIATASSDCTINIWYYNKVKNKFDLYNKIRKAYINDTIWSVSFAKNNQHILMSSADSLSLILSVNGDYATRTYVPFYNAYSRICYAKFSPDEYAVILTYYDSNQKNGELQSAYSDDERIVYLSAEGGKQFDCVSISPDHKYGAAVRAGENETLFMLMKNEMLLCTFKGNHPVFSPDGKYLLSVQDDRIVLYPIDINYFRKVTKQFYR